MEVFAFVQNEMENKLGVECLLWSRGILWFYPGDALQTPKWCSNKEDIVLVIRTQGGGDISFTTPYYLTIPPRQCSSKVRFVCRIATKGLPLTNLVGSFTAKQVKGLTGMNQSQFLERSKADEGRSFNCRPCGPALVPGRALHLQVQWDHKHQGPG